MFLDYLNTLLEFTSLALMYFILCPARISWKNILFYVVIDMTLAFYFVLDIPHFTYINIPLMLSALIISFRKDSFLASLAASSTSMLIMFLEEWIFFSLLPSQWLQTDFGNFLVTGSMICINTGLTYTFKHYGTGTVLSKLLAKYWYIIIVILLFFCFLGQSYLSRLSVYWHLLPGFVSLLVFLMLIVGSIIYIHYQHFKENLQSEHLLEMVSSSDHFITDIRVKNHDYKHHIQYILDQVSSATDLNELKLGLSKYVTDFSADRSIYETILAMDSSVLRSTLYGFYQKCESENIRFSLHSTPLLPAFPLKEYEFVEILQNLLTNSFEYTNSLPGDDRWINVTIYADATLNRFSVTNPLVDSSSVENFASLGYTSKSGHAGIGLFSVSELTSAHDIQFLIDRNSENQTVSFSLEYKELPHV